MYGNCISVNFFILSLSSPQKTKKKGSKRSNSFSSEVDTTKIAFLCFLWPSKGRLRVDNQNESTSMMETYGLERHSKRQKIEDYDVMLILLRDLHVNCC